MTTFSRAGSLLVGAAVAGFLLWLAAQVSRHTTGGYWAGTGIVAAAGLVFALSLLPRRSTGDAPAAFWLVFVPVLVAAGWIVLGAQPHANWFRDRVLSWSGDIGIRGVTSDLQTWLGVLAFGIGLAFGATFQPASIRRRRRSVVLEPAPIPATTVEPAASDEPIAAEQTSVTPAAEPFDGEGP